MLLALPAALLLLPDLPGAAAAPNSPPPAAHGPHPAAAPAPAPRPQAQAQSPAPSQPSSGRGAAAEPALPADPAAAAPQPPDLNQPPRPAQPLPQPSLPLARGIEALPAGGWRLSGGLARGQADAPAQAALAGIARWLAESSDGRVTLLAQVAGPEEDVSVARRDSLAHGQAIRRILEQGGLDGTRIDIRPLGRTVEARNAVDLLPPSARRAPASPPAGPAGSTPSQSQSRP
jgi:hypothetical protein